MLGGGSRQFGGGFFRSTVPGSMCGVLDFTRFNDCYVLPMDIFPFRALSRKIVREGPSPGFVSSSPASSLSQHHIQSCT